MQASLPLSPLQFLLTCLSRLIELFNERIAKFWSVSTLYVEQNFSVSMRFVCMSLLSYKITLTTTIKKFQKKQLSASAVSVEKLKYSCFINSAWIVLLVKRFHNIEENNCVLLIYFAIIFQDISKAVKYVKKGLSIHTGAIRQQ